MARKGYGFLLFDFPSDHEIEGAISTEADTIRAILSNRGFKSRLRSVRSTSLDTFAKGGARRYKEIQFVHLAGHGSSTSLGLIGGQMLWRKVAQILVTHVAPLPAGRKRVLSISCCHSREAFQRMRTHLNGFFSGAYYFQPDVIDFATAITVWSMFFLTKNLRHPEEAIVKRVNGFFDAKVLAFSRIRADVA